MTTESAEREMLWRVERAQELAWTQLGEDYVVYHRPSGRTHFLNGATALLLRRILLEPKSAAAAAEELAASENAAVDAAFLAAVADSLARLEHLGLIEPK